MNKTIRYSLVLASYLTIVNLFFISFAVILGINFDNSSLKWLFIVATSIIASIISTYIIFIATPLLKDYLQNFRRLLRLESLNHPLLVRFSHVAPGTYHHTLTVANIAARAAKSIGADSILTRVGSYYHDIGKIETPQYFVENQSEGNPHEKFNNPQKSAQIIIKHVTEGVKIAKENNLPQEIIDFITQHHGKTLVSYFYEEAKNNGIKTHKTDFRYPGPTPQSPESAILMLADSIEAAVRSQNNPTIDDIKKTINNIIEEKISDHQLDNAGLNSAQMAKIRRSFLDSLVATFHQRIEYPNSNNNNGRK